MITILSPAKNLNFKPQKATKKFTIPLYLDESEMLIHKMKTFSRKELSELVDINPKLADLNYNRYQSWNSKFNLKNAKQAVLAFNGDVYAGLKAKTLKSADLDFAQDNLIILSGLHGLLRPLDLIQPYCLEMGTEIYVKKDKNLYEFWSGKITMGLSQLLKNHRNKTIINLASNEYS